MFFSSLSMHRNEQWNEPLGWRKLARVIMKLTMWKTRTRTGRSQQKVKELNDQSTRLKKKKRDLMPVFNLGRMSQFNCNDKLTKTEKLNLKCFFVTWPCDALCWLQENDFHIAFTAFSPLSWELFQKRATNSSFTSGLLYLMFKRNVQFVDGLTLYYKMLAETI